MKSNLIGVMVLNLVVVLIGLLLMLRNLVSSTAFNIGLALTFLSLSIFLITKEINGKN
jgi:hypothetical protein